MPEGLLTFVQSAICYVSTAYRPLCHGCKSQHVGKLHACQRSTLSECFFPSNNFDQVLQMYANVLAYVT